MTCFSEPSDGCLLFWGCLQLIVKVVITCLRRWGNIRRKIWNSFFQNKRSSFWKIFHTELKKINMNKVSAPPDLNLILWLLQKDLLFYYHLTMTIIWTYTTNENQNMTISCVWWTETWQMSQIKRPVFQMFALCNPHDSNPATFSELKVLHTRQVRAETQK